MLRFVLPSFVVHYISTSKHSFILFLFMALCLFVANSVHYANTLRNIEIAAISKILAHKS